jgi:flagellar biosynthetic protein FlhB
VGTLAILFAGYMVLLLSGERAFSSLADFSRALFGGLADVEVSEATIIFGLSNSGMILVNALAPLLFAVTVAAVLSGGVQSLFKLTPKAIEMKAKRSIPWPGSSATSA